MLILYHSSDYFLYWSNISNIERGKSFITLKKAITDVGISSNSTTIIDKTSIVKFLSWFIPILYHRSANLTTSSKLALYLFA
jgi:hypothetical protein